MRVVTTRLPDVLVFEPRVFGDARGFFFESYNKRRMSELGLEAEFVQDNHSRSAKNVLRGLHYQIEQPQGKLVPRCWPVKHMTWRSISARVRRPSDAGWASGSVRTTAACSTYRPDSRTGFAC